MRLSRVLILSLLVAAISCQSITPLTIKMNKAAYLMVSAPDSALQIMASLPLEQVNTPVLRANFILLYVQVLERNSLPLIGGQYMEEAVDYFAKYGNKVQKVLSQYYMGKFYLNEGNLYGAMEQFVRAEGELASADEDSFRPELQDEILAKIKIEEGDIYLHRLNYGAAARMYNIAAEVLAQSSAKELLMQVQAKRGDAYRSAGDYSKALEAYGAARDLAFERGEREELFSYLTAIQGVNFLSGTPATEVLNELEQIYDEYNGGVAPIEDYLMLSSLYLSSRNLSKAKYYAAEYERLSGPVSSLEQSRLYSLLSSIESERKNFASALEYERKYISLMESIMEQEKQNSLIQVEQAYFNRQLQVENDSIRRSGRFLLIIYSLLFVIVVGASAVLLYGWRKKIRQKNGQIEQYLEAIHNSESSNQMLLSQLDTHKEQEKHLKELLEGRFAELKELAGTYYEFGFSKKLQKKVEQLLSFRLVEGDMFAIIEDVVNAKNNGAMSKIRAAYPSISAENIKLLSLIYAGFSPQEISVIINDTPQNIYVRKSRLKRKIAPLVESDPEIDFK